MADERVPVQAAVDAFVKQFQSDPDVAVAAPGRVNLIGEHVDYCDGFVFPMALEHATVIVGKKTTRSTCRLVTTSQVGSSSVVEIPASPGELQPDAKGSVTWSGYVRGVMKLFPAAFPAFDCAISTAVPLGGGLSSSAALEVAMYSFLEALTTGNVVNNKDKALVCQKAEQTFAHMPCGIMDQYISTCAKAGHALLIDCRSLDAELVPTGSEDLTVVVTNSNIKHSLVDGEYAERRESCAKALEVIMAANKKLTGWRDVTMADLDAVKASLSTRLFMRARHVISEIARTQDAADAFKAKDYAKFGKLMIDSHNSLKDDYEVTTPELDLLVELAVKVPGVFGARMTGGGFGGCTIALVEKKSVSALLEALTKGYPAGTSFYTAPSDGARTIDLAPFLEKSGSKRKAN